MTHHQTADLPIWKELKNHALFMKQPENHLKYLLKAKDRLSRFSRRSPCLLYDYSRQRVDEKALSLLFELARQCEIQARFDAMVRGEKINQTEGRAALHTASRHFSDQPILVDGRDIMPEIRKVQAGIKNFAAQVHSGEITGSTGKPFKHVVVIGIGGSYLGTEFVSEALYASADKGIRLHYLSNVDIHNFGNIISEIDPETTLWVVISKSYTTAETMANTGQAYQYMEQQGLNPAPHFVTVTAKGSPGDNPDAPVLCSFHMFDFIGGRYSVTSAVGGVPLSLYLGYDRFELFLKGAHKMDEHAHNTPMEENIPLIAALISVWNNNFLNYPAQAVIPYASPLKKLAPHFQQLNMESNGKSVTLDGKDLIEPAGTIIFGEPGTNAQHSFFQLAHQGQPFPIDFIGVINPQYDQYRNRYRGVTNHQELWANLISQPAALAVGKEDANRAKYFSGNRPSSTILLNDLSPESVGAILSFYEAKTIFEAFIWGINPFDQFGVELGKTMASGIRKEIASRNENPDHPFDQADEIAAFYLETLFKGSC